MKSQKNVISNILKIMIGAMALLPLAANADDNVIYQRGGSYTAWSNSDITKGEWGTTATIDATNGLALSGSKTAAATKTIAPTTGSTITLDAEWIPLSTISKSGGSSNNTYFHFGDSLRLTVYPKTGKVQLNINGGSKLWDVDATAGEALSIHLKVNTSDNTILEFTLKGTGINKTLEDLGERTTFCAVQKYTTLTLGATRKGSSSGDYSTYLKSVSVTEQTSAPTTVTATIGSTGYATFSSTQALDFSTSGITAYIATAVDGNNVTLTSVTTVPANTGLILKGNQGDYSIPVTTNADNVDTNLLVAVSESTSVEKATDGNNYVLGKKDDNIGFYLVGDTAATVSAGHAYLHTQASTSPAKLALNISGTVTGIDNISNAVMPNGQDKIYDLQGRQISKPAKGIYIMNGKKYLQK